MKPASEFHELLSRITPLPWKVGHYGGIYPAGNGCPLIAHAETKSGKCGDNWSENEHYLVHAANILPKLIKEHNFVMREILEASGLDDDGRLRAINELIRRFPGFTALDDALTLNQQRRMK